MTKQKSQCKTIAQVARYLRISTDAVKSLIARGELKAMDLTQPWASQKTYRITPQALAEFEKAKAVEAGPMKVRRRKKGEHPEWV